MLIFRFALSLAATVMMSVRSPVRACFIICAIALTAMTLHKVSSFRIVTFAAGSGRPLIINVRFIGSIRSFALPKEILYAMLFAPLLCLTLSKSVVQVDACDFG